MATPSPCFFVDNTGTQDVTHYPACIGVPVAIGELWTDSTLCLYDEDGQEYENAIFEVVSFWPDKSIKWLRIRFLVTLPLNARLGFYYAQRLSVKNARRENRVCYNDDVITINCTNAKRVEINTRELAGLASQEISKSTFQFNIVGAASPLTTHVNNVSYKTLCNQGKQVFVEVSQIASLAYNNNLLLNIALTLVVVIETGDILLSCTLTNPHSAEHPNGKWDLGDPKSIFIKSADWQIQAAEKISSVTCLTEPGAAPQAATQGFILHQAASGYENWQSPIHVDKDNAVVLPFNGYRVHQGNTLAGSGNQANPSINIAATNSSSYVFAKQFWQNFPSAVSVDQGIIKLSILGVAIGPLTELQPGEQKTREFTLSSQHHAGASVSISLNRDCVLKSYACNMLFCEQQDSEFAALINLGIDSHASFFNKRLMSDVFAWRHFGELYADHEKALAPDKTQFVSHYNNQYDPIYGFLLQWIRTGDQRWYELGDDLAKHVADIDVYHTQEDKPDYCGGLFWHTDHYVEAATATHRTYSKHQPKNVYDDHAGGGGPGGQHCYTQGLLLHYQLTGHKPSQRALLAMCAWIESLYEGDGTLLALIIGIKNRARRDLKNIVTGEYPLDRGTGNYIHALLDKYELTGKNNNIHKVEHIIMSTVSPDDDILIRDLHDKENTWFYTVFFQAVCRYLCIKSEQLNEGPDNNAAHIVLSLVHYVEWILENEYLYLDKPDILEFPNQTWTAQDCRKVCLLSFIRPYMTAEKQKKLDKKFTQFIQGIKTRLTGNEETSTTRILCLLMQNAHYNDYAVAGQRCFEWTKKNPLHFTAYTGKDTLIVNIKKALKNFSISREYRQATRRFPQLKKQAKS